MAKKKTATRKKKTATRKKKPVGKRKSAGKKNKQNKKRTAAKRRPRPARRTSVDVSLDAPATSRRRGLGAGSAGQSGDTQGLSNAEETDFESVEELVEEGQTFEAGVVAGVEDADASGREVRTRQVLEDDVPLEYLEKD